LLRDMHDGSQRELPLNPDSLPSLVT